MEVAVEGNKGGVLYHEYKIHVYIEIIYSKCLLHIACMQFIGYARNQKPGICVVTALFYVKTL